MTSLLFWLGGLFTGFSLGLFTGVSAGSNRHRKHDHEMHHLPVEDLNEKPYDPDDYRPEYPRE